MCLCSAHSFHLHVIHDERLIVCSLSVSSCLSFCCFSLLFTSSLPDSTCTLTSTSFPMSTASRELTTAPSHNEEYCTFAIYHPPTSREGTLYKNMLKSKMRHKGKRREKTMCVNIITDAVNLSRSAPGGQGPHLSRSYVQDFLNNISGLMKYPGKSTRLSDQMGYPRNQENDVADWAEEHAISNQHAATGICDVLIDDKEYFQVIADAHDPLEKILLPLCRALRRVTAEETSGRWNLT